MPSVVAEGVVRLGSLLVNWYVVEEGGRVTVVDAGVPGDRPQLPAGLALLGRSEADIAARPRRAGGGSRRRGHRVAAAGKDLTRAGDRLRRPQALQAAGCSRRLRVCAKTNFVIRACSSGATVTNARP